MKRTPLKKISKKREQKLHLERAENVRMWGFLASWYLLLPPGSKVCQSCGKKLPDLPAYHNFDHLIEKSKRPDLAMETDNIFLCCLDCHTLKTNGHPTEKHEEAIRKAKEIFGIS